MSISKPSQWRGKTAARIRELERIVLAGAWFWAYAQNMMAVGTHVRMAVAEEEKEDLLAPRLGRAVKFALFDVNGKEVRGPFYRVRHDDPGNVCDEHAELAALLHDCKVVIAGSVGPRMAQRLQDLGIEVVATPERRTAAQLVNRFLAGNLEQNP
jgi:predicted Fe-Mo cluster-binding NifX family protein